MKNCFKIVLGCMLFVFSACEKSGENSGGLSAVPERETFPGTEGTYDLAIEAGSSWELETPSGSWVSFSPRKGKGAAIVKMKMEGNAGNARTETVQLKSGNSSYPIVVKQEGASTYSVYPPTAQFGAGTTPMTLTVTTPGSWSIRNADEAPWLELSSTQGSEGGKITMTPKPLTERYPRGPVRLEFDMGSGQEPLYVTVSQRVVNSAPSGPEPVSPTAIHSGSESIRFAWNRSTDADGDAVKYTVYLSTDNLAWEQKAEGLTEPEYRTQLAQGKYYWKVKATDVMETFTESSSRMFYVSTVNVADEQIEVYRNNTVGGAAPVNIVFMGEGYTMEDYLPGGAFERHLQTSVDALFSVEPFKTYRNYFRITVVKAFSAEQGVTIRNAFTSGAKLPAQTKNTKFNLYCEGGSSSTINVSGDSRTPVRDYVRDILGLTADQLNDYSAFILVNADAWAGTCYSYKGGFSIAMTAADYNLGKRLVHEGGGHGVGRLKDEYIDYPNEFFSEDQKTTLNDWRAGDPWSYAGNVDITGSLSEVHWKSYFTLPGYENVGLTEGNYTYGKGVWRPGTANNIMMGSSNTLFFNAPSRESIVRRIMKLAGQVFDFQQFLAKDDNTAPVSRMMTGLQHVMPKETPPVEEAD